MEAELQISGILIVWLVIMFWLIELAGLLIIAIGTVTATAFAAIPTL